MNETYLLLTGCLGSRFFFAEARKMVRHDIRFALTSACWYNIVWLKKCRIVIMPSMVVEGASWEEADND